MMTKKEELKAEFPFIRSLGYDPMIIYAQAHVESGGFKKVIGNANYWGIQWSPSWKGLKKTIYTPECELAKGNETEDQAQVRLAKKWGVTKEDVHITHQYTLRGSPWWQIHLWRYFRDWENVHEAVKWYDGLIQRMYPEAYAARTNYEIYYPALVSYKNKWATDPEYAETCIRRYREITNIKG